MPSSLYVVAFAVAVSLASVAAHDFSTCYNSPTKVSVKTVNVTPDPPQGGQSVSIAVTAVNNQQTPLTQPKTELKVYWLAIPIFSDTIQLCTDGGTSCPVAAGAEFSGTVTYDVPSQSSGHHVMIVTTIEDKSGTKLECVQAYTSVSVSSVGSPALAAPVDPVFGGMGFLFKSWQQQYGIYFPTPEEHSRRFKIFAENINTMARHDARSDATFQVAANRYTHLTWDEFRDTLLMDRQSVQLSVSSPTQAPSRLTESMDDIPSSFDWSSKGALTPVRDQAGQACRDSWALAGATCLEAAYYLHTGNLRTLSAQQILDCGHGSCRGGTVQDAFISAQKNGGVCAADVYPSLGRNSTCRRSCVPVPGSGVAGSTRVAANASALAAAVVTQPVAVMFTFVPEMQFYSGGIFSETCQAGGARGAVVVGFGDDGTGRQYWKVQESLGTSWGESGFIRLARNGDHGPGGECGILSGAYYPNMG